MDRDRLRIIVGVDYGTTFSGVSYVVSNQSDANQIEVINQWPGTSETVCKVPSRIAYANENTGWEKDRWGFSAGAQSYSWTKLLLDGGTTLSKYDDPALKDIFGNGMMSLPPYMTAKEVCTDYLRFLNTHLVQTLCKRFTKEIYDVTPVDLWITVPAIWSDAAKDATKKAAIAAGLGARNFDRVSLIPEPEAAALTALKPLLATGDSLDPVNAGDVILVCDCGGGTVDITTYRIVSTQPFQFEELCLGIGGKCGSTFIDRNFNKWMKKTFGKVYTKLPQKKRGPGSPFMNSFEIAKKMFGSEGRADQRFIEIGFIHMDISASNHYDPEEGTVKLTWDEMKGFFDPVVEEIIRLLGTQVDFVKSNENHVKRVVLVGGFGDSDYLNERLSLWKSQLGNGIKLTCPPQPQAAIVRGAALRGLDGLHPTLRFARRHYGYGSTQPFRPDIDPESLRCFCPFYEQSFCSSRTDWKVSKGQAIESNKVVVFNLFRTFTKKAKTREVLMPLYACSREIPPEYRTDPAAEKIGEVAIQFSESDLKGGKWRYSSKLAQWVCMVELEVRMNMNAEEGTLTFQTFVSGRPAGNATINYLEHEIKGPQQCAKGKDAQQSERPNRK